MANKKQREKRRVLHGHPHKTLENSKVVVEMLRQETWLTSLQSDIQRNVDMNKKKRAMKRHRGRHPKGQLHPPENISVRALYQAAIGEEQ